jgi:hypothetical protein
LSLDTFYVGKLKGVGKIWQITGCDAACSYAWARLVVGEVTAAAVRTFLRDDVRPTRPAGSSLSTIRSGRKCYLCLQNELSPM